MQQVLGTVIPLVCIVAAVVIIALAAWRFFNTRHKGNAAIARKLPAKGTHGWRHGRIVYSGEYLRLYKLRSLSPSADATFERQDITVRGQRSITDAEGSFMDSRLQVLELTVANDEYEMAVDSATAMALTSWIEAAPDIRRQRANFQQLKQYGSPSQPPHNNNPRTH